MKCFFLKKSWLPVLAIVCVACSSDKDEPKLTDPIVDGKEEPTMLSEADFKAKVENKIWVEESNQDITWITTDGKVLTIDDMPEMSGTSYKHAFLFNEGKATYFTRHVWGMHPDYIPLKRYMNYIYEYNPLTGGIKFIDVTVEKKNLAMEIESVTENELVIHDQNEIYSDDEDIAYRRVILRAVPKDEEEAWRSEYVYYASK